MNKIQNFSIYFIGVIVILAFTAYRANNSEDAVVSAEYNNEIFTEDLYNSLVEVDFWVGNEKIVINNEDDMKNIFRNFSSLTLTEAPKEELVKCGHQSINIITSDKTLGIGLLSDEMYVENQRYYIDKDIVDSIRDIAYKKEVICSYAKKR